MTLRRSFRIIIFLGFFASAHADVLLFDLGLTLVKPNTSAALKSLGWRPLVRHFFDFFIRHPLSIFSFKNHLQAFYTTTLARIPSPCASTDCGMLMPEGTTMPLILQDFLSGKLSAPQAMDFITTWAQDQANKSHFINTNHRNIFLSIARFNIIDLAHNLEPMPCARLLAHCARQKNADGTPKHVCIIVSNWAREHIAPFKKHFKNRIMAYTSACIFSCDGYGPKPCPSFFQHCAEVIRTQFPMQYNKRWVIIDDQRENLKAAKAYLRDNVICCTPNHAHTVLKRFGIISR